MARSRLRPGLYQVNNPGGYDNGSLTVDNRNILVPKESSLTVNVNIQGSYETGKYYVEWIADNPQGFSGNITTNTP